MWDLMGRRESKDLGDGLIIDKELWFKCQAFCNSCGFEDPKAFVWEAIRRGVEVHIRQRKA